MGSPNHLSACGPSEDAFTLFLDNPYETLDEILDQLLSPPIDHRFLQTLGLDFSDRATMGLGNYDFSSVDTWLTGDDNHPAAGDARAALDKVCAGGLQRDRGVQPLGGASAGEALRSSGGGRAT